jgi:hypothetical protein
VRRAAALAAISLLALLAGSASGASTPRLIECQHPVRTGVEVYHLIAVKSAAACPVALKLFAWEYKQGNITKLYGCKSLGHPFLRLHRFDGWALSIVPAGDFEMSRGASSFYVTGTDFPLNCT